MAASAWLSFLALCLGPRSSVAVQMPRVVAVPVTVPAGRAASARNSDVAAGAAGAAAWQAVGAKKAGVAYLGSDLPWDSCSAVGGCEVDAGLSIGGQRYSKGIFAHADSSIAFTLGGAYEKFHACFGIAELVDTGCGVSSGETSFVVKLDGDSVYEETNDASDPPYCIIVDVTQKMKMELLTISGTTAHCDHSAWFDARVTRSAASPSTKSPAASLAKEAAGAALAPAPAGRAASAQKGALSLLGSGAPAGAVGAAARPAGRAAAKAKKDYTSLPPGGHTSCATPRKRKPSPTWAATSPMTVAVLFPTWELPV